VKLKCGCITDGEFVAVPCAAHGPAPGHHENCDVNDFNADNIRKPCNCGAVKMDIGTTGASEPYPVCPNNSGGRHYVKKTTADGLDIICICKCGQVFRWRPIPGTNLHETIPMGSRSACSPACFTCNDTGLALVSWPGLGVIERVSCPKCPKGAERSFCKLFDLNASLTLPHVEGEPVKDGLYLTVQNGHVGARQIVVIPTAENGGTVMRPCVNVAGEPTDVRNFPDMEFWGPVPALREEGKETKYATENTK
jgi:hypothetical protein